MGGGDLGTACPTVKGTELWKSVNTVTCSLFGLPGEGMVMRK